MNIQQLETWWREQTSRPNEDPYVIKCSPLSSVPADSLSDSFPGSFCFLVLGAHLAGTTHDPFTTGDVGGGPLLMTENRVGQPWTPYEDNLLIQAVAIHGENDNWKNVALCVPGRTNKACRKVREVCVPRNYSAG